MQENEQKTQSNDESSLKTFVMELLTTVLKNLEKTIAQNIKEKFHEAKVRAERSIAALLLLSLGAIFFLVGLAYYLNSVITIEGIGYIIVGIGMAIIGLIIKPSSD